MGEPQNPAREPFEFGVSKDGNSVVMPLDNSEGAYASGYTVMGDKTVAITTANYTALYMPTFGTVDATAEGRYMGFVFYNDGSQARIYESGGVGLTEAAGKQAHTDFMDALKKAQDSGLYFPPEGTSVAAGSLMDQAKAGTADELAFINEMKQQYGEHVVAAVTSAPKP